MMTSDTFYNTIKDTFVLNGQAYGTDGFTSYRLFSQSAYPVYGYYDQSFLSEIFRLRKAIINHRSQKADDRCIEDDDRLYETLGDGIKCDRSVGSPEAMLKNCERFIKNRCQGGNWPSYADLEDRIRVLEQQSKDDW